MDIVKRLRTSKSRVDVCTEWYLNPDASEAADEIEQLREDKAELVEALNIAADGFMDSGEEDLEDMCRAVIAKATGGE